MRFVDKPVARPHTCAVVPGRGAAEKGRWIDTGNELMGWEPHIYISEAGGSEVARMLGWTSPKDRAELDNELSLAHERIAQLEAELREADQYKDNIDGLMKHGYLPRKAPGRPKNKVAT